MTQKMKIEGDKAVLTVAEGEVLAARIIAIRDDTSPPEDRETLLLAANVIRKAVPALRLVDAIMRHCRATMTPADAERLEGAIAKALEDETA